MKQKEEFEATIDSRGSINIPVFLQKQKGFEPGVRVKVILEIIETKINQEVKALA